MKMEMPTAFANLPAHEQIAARILRFLEEDERVLGVYLSGSFARGNPDAYSDLDFYILVPGESREQVEEDHAKLRAEVGDIVSDFPATHLGDPHQFITFYRGSYPVHVDYQYRVSGELMPRESDMGAIVLLDRSGELQQWKDKCAGLEESHSPTQESLQYFEDRFWAWCMYTDSKVKRGELWEARAAIESIRGTVLVRLAHYVHGLRPEGSRRIETKLPRDMVLLLESTLPRGHAPRDYSQALLALAAAYAELMGQATREFNLAIQEKDRAYFMGLLRDRGSSGTRLDYERRGQ